MYLFICVNMETLVHFKNGFSYFCIFLEEFYLFCKKKFVVIESKPNIKICPFFSFFGHNFNFFYTFNLYGFILHCTEM